MLIQEIRFNEILIGLLLTHKMMGKKLTEYHKAFSPRGVLVAKNTRVVRTLALAGRTEEKFKAERKHLRVSQAVCYTLGSIYCTLGILVKSRWSERGLAIGWKRANIIPSSGREVVCNELYASVVSRCVYKLEELIKKKYIQYIRI